MEDDEAIDPEDILDPSYVQQVSEKGAEGMPCPACGSPLTQAGFCKNPECEA